MEETWTAGRVNDMEDASTLRLQVNPQARNNAEKILERLGIPLSTAVDMFFRQISLTGGLPFSVSLPKAPDSVNMDKMTEAEFHERLSHSYEQSENGDIKEAAAVFAAFRKERAI